jgi:hypothetical protein
MTFPATPLDLTVELYLSGAWTDVTSLTYGRDPLVITRGRSGEGAEVDRSTCRFTANNRSGNLSPRNPTGSYYGQLGRNTPCRVRVTPGPTGYLLMPVELDGAETPDSANLSITGDIDVRVDVRFDDWDTFGGLANKLSGASQRSWAFYKNASGTLTFAWSADGSALLTATSTTAVVVPASGRLAVRVSLDVDNGAAGKDVKFYTASSIDGSWTQLGSTVTTATTTSIFDSTASVQIGRSNFGTGIVGRLYAFQLYQGIAGTLRADVDLSDEEPGPGPFTDGQSVSWTLVADASIVRPDIRFSGELSDLPQRWDVSGTDVYVPVEASGVLRRLGQGAAALKSTIYRGMTTLASPPKAYWPCEDGTDATQIASAFPGHPPMTLIGTPDFAASDEFKCSAPLPTMSLSQWTGLIPAYTVTGNTQVWLLLRIPAAGTTDDQGIFRMHMGGTSTLQFVDLVYQTVGDLELRVTDNADNIVLSSVIGFDLDGLLVRVAVDLEQNGANIDWGVDVREVGSAYAVGNGGTISSETAGRAVAVVINPGADLDDVVAGHVSVSDQIRGLDVLKDEVDAYAGETAARRVQRLCGEEGIAFRGVGGLDAASPMGPQTPAKLVDLLRECATADGGILYEPRDLLGLAYRTRDSLCAQTAYLELDYAAFHLSEPVEPTDDDQHLRNDVTTTRPGGSSARAVKETGALSILPPPDGVGVYDEQVSLNLQLDGQLEDMAGWRVHLGTVDQTRYPVLKVELHRAPFVASSALALAAADLEVGDRLLVANPPAWLPPDDIAQLAQGFTETCSNFNHAIEVNCAPSAPFDQAGVYDSSRYSSDGSTLAEDLTTVETGVDVATPSGPLWTHADGDFDIIVGGERMTVTAISGAASPQTFTCTRSVNSVVKTHSTGAEVALAEPAVYVP